MLRFTSKWFINNVLFIVNAIKMDIKYSNEDAPIDDRSKPQHIDAVCSDKDRLLLSRVSLHSLDRNNIIGTHCKEATLFKFCV